MENCPWSGTASSPIAIVSWILACFSSFRVILSDTNALLRGREFIIVTQDPDRWRIRKQAAEQINFSDQQMSGILHYASDGVNFEVCKRRAFTVARSTC